MWHPKLRCLLGSLAFAAVASQVAGQTTQVAWTTHTTDFSVPVDTLPTPILVISVDVGATTVSVSDVFYNAGSVTRTMNDDEIFIDFLYDLSDGLLVNAASVQAQPLIDRHL